MDLPVREGAVFTPWKNMEINFQIALLFLIH